jgi:hypothetical protein
LPNGVIGFLYNLYDPATDRLSQHFATTADDFASIDDALLATESNASPVSEYAPYLGDFFDLTSVGDVFFGAFSASNADDGVLAYFPSIEFQREFAGAPGSSSFQLRDGAGGVVGFSIDPFVFTAEFSVPEPIPAGLLGFGFCGIWRARRARASSA